MCCVRFILSDTSVPICQYNAIVCFYRPQFNASSLCYVASVGFAFALPAKCQRVATSIDFSKEQMMIGESLLCAHKTHNVGDYKGGDRLVPKLLC